jgi:hypothetical protein
MNNFINTMQPISDINLSKCPHCQTLFAPKSLTRKSTYCSEKCRNNAKYRKNPGKHNAQTYSNQQERGLLRKQRLIEYKGGKCEICGYDKNYCALCFHHTDPSQKSMGLDIRRLSNNSWDKILVEAEKCQLLCHNCHMEIHHPFGTKP